RRSVSMNTPYSSAVCSRRLVRTQDTRSRSPSKTPIFVLVLPTSATSSMDHLRRDLARDDPLHPPAVVYQQRAVHVEADGHAAEGALRSEEHTSELQSRGHLVCRLLLEKKNKKSEKKCQQSIQENEEE